MLEAGGLAQPGEAAQEFAGDIATGATASEAFHDVGEDGSVHVDVPNSVEAEHDAGEDDSDNIRTELVARSMSQEERDRLGDIARTGRRIEDNLANIDEYDRVVSAQGKLDEAKAKLATSGNEWMREINEEEVEYAQEDLEAVKADSIADLEESLDEVNAEFKQEDAEISQPFEELYDNAPEVAAGMSVEEFMNAGRELKELNNEVNHAEWAVRQSGHVAGQLVAMLHNRSAIGMERVAEEMPAVLAGAAGLSKEGYEELKARIEAIGADTFDTSPRERIEGKKDAEGKVTREGCSQVVIEFNNTLREAKVQADQRKQEFLDNFAAGQHAQTGEAVAQEAA